MDTEDIVAELTELLEQAIMDYLNEVPSTKWMVSDLVTICDIIIRGFMVDLTKIIKEDGSLPN
jgi:hypothetical protein